MVKAIILFSILFLFCISAYANEGCQTNLTKDDNYSTLSKILKCLNDRIIELESQLNKNRKVIVAHPAGEELNSNQEVSLKSYTYGLLGCSRSGEIVTCNLVITNRKSDEKLTLYSNYFNYKSRVIDYSGREYLASSVSVSTEESDSSIRKLFIKGVSMATSISFPNIAVDVNALALLDFVTSEGHAKFKNVPISN